MLTPRRQARTLLLCLLLRNVQSQFAVANEYTVDGTADQSATLPCKLTIPSNWKDDELHVMWFKNFTEKLWDWLRSHGLGKDNSAQWMGSVVTPFSWTIVLPSGWLLAIFLAVVLLWQRLCVSRRKTQILLSR
ncbi:hypothetical protein GDO78_017906 [Eleutherodactylus coqui]|uniref:Uncharacterized protein n=1 Tax=Eleutherodactylus coqui TaxID=57060 RepID=A0A8J6EK14_ELECQ|nr:hypothetical protein GDO78_017906 [Eleutherodactylus coqui]